MNRLSVDRVQAAVGFLASDGRPLDHAIFRYEFLGGDAEAVLRELSPYQNPDGGFGHRLEPDAVVAESSVLDTTHGLQIIQRVGVAADDPIPRAAMGYLRKAYREPLGGWPIRPFASAQTPCAPWWKSADESEWWEKMKAGRLNPTAEVLGYFLDYGQPADHGVIECVSATVARWIDQADEPLESHELLCLARLTRAAGLSEDRRAAWVGRVGRDVATAVNPDPASWDGYGLKPWWIAETPDDAMLGELEPGLVAAMLDHEMDRQEDDGGWPPFWDWGGLHAAAWADARRAWKSVLTEQMLRVLRNHGRLPEAAD